jgi:arginyl-tRNA synthetase
MFNVEVKVLKERGWDANKLTLEEVDCSLLVEPEARALAYELSRFPMAVYASFVQLEASNIVNYMFDVCHTVSSAHSKLNVIKANEAEGKARLALFHAARIVVAKGLTLLGLKPLEKM